MVHIAMPVTYGNANYQKKFDAFKIVHESGQEPLRNAIAVALAMRQTRDTLEKAYDAADPEMKAKISLAIAKCAPDEFNAWVKIAEFIYAKPKQQLEVSGTVTLEQVLAASMGTPAIGTTAE